jgi:oligopeptide transport system permease protein
MSGYIFRRLLQSLLVVLFTFTLTFAMVRLAPGGPFAKDRAVSAEILAAQERAYGLDAPIVVQYVRALGLLLRGDLGPSYVYEGRTVNDLIADALPISLAIGFGGLVIAVLIGMPLGVVAAVRRNSVTDHLATGCALLGICLPGFVLGPVLALVFGIQLNWFNASGWYDASDWVLPSATLGLFYAAYIARLARVGTLEVLALDHIRTARAKGLPGWLVVGRHALRQAILPVVSFLGPAMAGLVSGSIVIERVFQIPGLGYHFVGAALNRDYYLAQGTVVLYAGLIVVMNLVVDLVQAVLDPRMREKGGSRL